MENNDIFLTGADINDEKKENENEVIEQKDMNQIEDNKEENQNETTDKQEKNKEIENENVNENETIDKKETNPELKNEDEIEKENENEINKEIKNENENENETEKKETNLEVENEKNETSEIKETNNEVENENKNETPEKKDTNIETENENEKNENNKEVQNEEEKINESPENNETENNKENEITDENSKIESIKNKGSPFLTEALEDINEEIKEEINQEEIINNNKKREEEKEKVGQYYFPMIINRYRKENYSSAGYLFNHPQRPIDTSKKLNFKTNPGLCRGPVKMNFKPKRDITPINDLMNYLQEIFHIPPSSRSVSIPYDNFRERMKFQFLSRSPHVFGNFKFPPKNIVYHSIDSNYREDKIIKARNIAMVKLPKIKQVYNYSSQDNIHKNDVKNYSISKPF